MGRRDGVHQRQKAHARRKDEGVQRHRSTDAHAHREGEGGLMGGAEGTRVCWVRARARAGQGGERSAHDGERKGEGGMGSAEW